jgi:hypothetical protein
MAMVKLFTSDRVTMGSDAYHAQRAKAERIAAQQRSVNGSGVVRWDDEYNDHSARGVFVVTGRA